MHTIKKLKRTIVFILKLALFASLFGIFFGIFGINNPCCSTSPGPPASPW